MDRNPFSRHASERPVHHQSIGGRGVSEIVLVTEAYHAPRIAIVPTGCAASCSAAAQLARGQGYACSPAFWSAGERSGLDWLPSTEGLANVRQALHEVLGLTKPGCESGQGRRRLTRWCGCGLPLWLDRVRDRLVPVPDPWSRRRGTPLCQPKTWRRKSGASSDMVCSINEQRSLSTLARSEGWCQA